jgi:hypothetical protein
MKMEVQNVELRRSAGLTGSRYNPVAHFGDYGTKPSVSVKGGSFLE